MTSGAPAQPMPMVSISVTAHKHAAFLAECLDGILQQQCSFVFEILLSEDDSGDGTREIAQRYAAAHPDRIRLFLHDRSSVIHIDGRPTGRHGLINNLRHARGRYLCHIDGDDSWTDPDRLRIMVERMEAEPDLMLAFHNAWNLWPDGRREPYFVSVTEQDRYHLAELTERNFIPTSGVIWRFSAMGALPEALHTGPFGDWVLNIHFARLGPIGYVDGLMSNRRVHPQGAMSSMSEVRTMRTTALAYEVMHGQVGDALAPRALDRWTKLVTDGFETALKGGSLDDAKWFLAHADAVPHGRIDRRQRLRWWLLVHFPRSMARYHRLRTGKR